MNRLILVLLFAAPLVSSTFRCPAWSPELPCNCTGDRVVCSGRMVPQVELATALDMIPEGSFDLTLDMVRMDRLPASVASANVLTMVDCWFRDLRTPMEWPNLEHAVFESVTTMHSPWSLVEGAKNLISLSVKKSSMTPTISEEFREQVSDTVSSLTLAHTGTSTIEPGSMTHLKNLGLIDFSGMPFKTFPRSALPDELPNLIVIFVTNTLLEKLEPSFFDGMPNLQGVMLHNNKFSTLDASWFIPRSKYLRYAAADGNPLACSCDLLWMMQEPQIFKTKDCYNKDLNLVKIEDYC